MIRATNQLTEQERKAAKALIASCQAHDQTFREPYLSNMLNFNPNMPAFFLYYQEGELLGLLTVYADDEDVEVSILVDPSHRREGIARAMYRSFEKEMASYPIRSVTFQTERVFLDHHPDLASHWGLVEDEETETWLGRDRTPYALDSRSDVKVLLAEPSYLDEISQLHHQAFSDEVETLEVVKEAVEAGVDIIMLDNMDHDQMQEAVALIAGRAEIEISGNVTKANVASYLDLDVQYVSSGALTHSAKILDLSLKNLHPVC